MRAFLQHRKEMNKFLSSSRNITYNRYNRLMIITCLDTFLNLPLLIMNLAVTILEKKPTNTNSILNMAYITGENLHHGASGNVTGISISSIVQIPASAWTTSGLYVLDVKWAEWTSVLYAVVFFGVFGTTPEMRVLYRSAFWFIPMRFGYKRRHITDIETVSDMSFNSNLGPAQQEASRSPDIE